jgi:carbon catabolite-derepressing protein kinase
MLTPPKASLTTSQKLQPFLAQSPPAWDSHMPATPQLMASRLAQAADAHANDSSDINQGEQNVAPAPSLPEEPEPTQEYVSKIGILASSMPYYHNQYMEKRKANVHLSDGEPLDSHEASMLAGHSLDVNPKEQSSEDQEATVRRLKPHSRSTIQLQHITSSPAEAPDPSNQDKKKGKITKWQFGIRSRNQPMDAMLCIYRALKAQGAQWHVPPPKTHQSDRRVKPTHCDLEDHRSADRWTPRLSATGTPVPRNHDRPDAEDSHGRNSEEEVVDLTVFPENYLPKDPWCMHVRWRKDGMFPPGTIHPNSTHSSHIDLTNDDDAHRRSSVIGSLSSVGGSATSVAGGALAITDNACYVYMDVQLYTLEADCYLVDFKCAGYETIIEAVINDSEKKLVGSGIRVADKDVTSPQPFLDLTNKLVIHLARGG